MMRNPSMTLGRGVVLNTSLKAGLLTSLLLFIAPVLAGTQTGKVTSLKVRASDGLIYFTLTGQHSNAPACTAGTNYWMIKNENSETGKRQFAQLLAARSTGATVEIVGAGTCTRWFDGEDVDQVDIMAN